MVRQRGRDLCMCVFYGGGELERELRMGEAARERARSTGIRHSARGSCGFPSLQRDSMGRPSPHEVSYVSSEFYASAWKYVPTPSRSACARQATPQTLRLIARTYIAPPVQRHRHAIGRVDRFRVPPRPELGPQELSISAQLPIASFTARESPLSFTAGRASHLLITIHLPITILDSKSHLTNTLPL